MPYFSDDDVPSVESLRQTQFELCIASNEIGEMQNLLRKGVDINAECAKYFDGNTLVLAAESGSTEAVKFLVHNGVNLESNALCAAAVYGYGEIVEILLKAGIKPDSDTIVSVAGTENVKIIEILIQAGAPINAPSSKGLFFALHNAVLAGHLKVVDVLLKAGANPNVIDEGGSTPLMMSAYGCDPDIARLLLSYGADALLINADGETATDMANANGSDSHIEIFSRINVVND